MKLAEIFASYLLDRVNGDIKMSFSRYFKRFVKEHTLTEGSCIIVTGDGCEWHYKKYQDGYILNKVIDTRDSTLVYYNIMSSDCLHKINN